MRGNRRATRGRVSLAAGLLLAGVMASGCQPPKPVAVDFSETPRTYIAKDYERVYKQWTRHEASFSDVDVALEAWATFKSWDFREAYIERYVAIYSLSDADRATLRQSQLEAFHRAYEFHVTAQSASYKWNDLEKSSSAWRVTLVDAIGHEIPPEYIRVERLPDAYEREFFPAKTPFSKSYAIRFLVPASGSSSDFLGVRSGSVTLRIASPIGRLELIWQST
jgi:hypothetical protein